MCLVTHLRRLLQWLARPRIHNLALNHSYDRTHAHAGKLQMEREQAKERQRQREHEEEQRKKSAREREIEEQIAKQARREERKNKKVGKVKAILRELGESVMKYVHEFNSKSGDTTIGT